MDKTQIYIIRQNALTNANVFWSKEETKTEEKVLATAQKYADWVLQAQSDTATVEEDKKWLNFNTPEYSKAIEFIKGGGNISDIRKKYKVSKKVSDELAKL